MTDACVVISGKDDIVCRKSRAVVVYNGNAMMSKITGCTLSSAIACSLAQGLSLAESIEAAKKYLTGALGAMLDLGHGSGPLDHTYAIRL